MPYQNIDAEYVRVYVALRQWKAVLVTVWSLKDLLAA
jgi:hypothetical protein